MKIKDIKPNPNNPRLIKAELPFYIKKSLSALKQDIYLSENEMEQDYLNL